MLAPQIAATGAFGSSAGDGRVGMVDTRDVAAVAATIAAAPAAHDRKTYWLTGPGEHLLPGRGNHAEARPGSTGHLHPVDRLRAEAGDGRRRMSKPLAAMNAAALGLFAQGDSDWVTDDVQTITGTPPRSVEQFVVDHAEAFGGLAGSSAGS